MSHEVQAGDLVAGKYRVERALGAGGMGVVVAARHLQLDVPVAIKMLRPALLDDRDVVLRFEREARAAARISNEHVARVFDVGTLPSGAPYMVMEFLEGRDLGEMLAQRGPLPVDEVVDCILQTCAALHEAHALGIIHRDLKPANLFCVRRPDGQPFIKVLDFGISKLSDATRSGMSATRTATLLGTPLYMSPEQMRSSKDVDVQSDVWSLGVVLYELLTGAPPFVGDSLPEVCVRIATETAPRLRGVRPDLPAALETIVARCLERERSRRFATIADLAAALSEFAPTARSGVGSSTGPGRVLHDSSARRTVPAFIPAGETAVALELTGRSERSPDRRRFVVIAAGALGAMAATAVVVAVGLRSPASTATTASPGGPAVAVSHEPGDLSAASAPPLHAEAPLAPGPPSASATGSAAGEPTIDAAKDSPAADSAPSGLRRSTPKGRSHAAVAAGSSTPGAVTAPASAKPGTSSGRPPTSAKPDDAYERM